MSENTDQSHAAKRIFITGASSGIGRCTAAKLASHGHHLYLTGRDEERLKAAAAECKEGGAASVDFSTGDVTSLASMQQVTKAAVETMGGIEVVIHCAGIGFIQRFEETSDADFLRVSNTNQRGTFFVAKATCPLMAEQKKGLFITLPGILGKAGMKGAAAYAASKWAVAGLVKCLAAEYAHKKLRFCLLYLGGVDSPFWDDLGMKVSREHMIPVDTAASLVVQAVQAPDHLVLNEIVMQPESHQLVS